MFRPTLKTPPAEQPVTLSEVKAHCVVDFSDDDTLLTGLIGAAVAHLDGFRGILGRAIITQTWSLSQARLRRDFTLPVPDVSAVSITYVDADGVEQSVPSEHVSVYPVASGSRVVISSDFSAPALESGNAAPVTVDFTCGYGAAADVPQSIKLAIYMLVATWYEERTDGEEKSVPSWFNAVISPVRWVAV